MKKRDYILLIAGALFVAPSYAADAVLGIKTKLVYNCSTAEMAQAWCELRGACCDVIEPAGGVYEAETYDDDLLYEAHTIEDQKYLTKTEVFE